MSHEALNIIDNVFNQIDTNNDGNIEVKEAERIFLRLNSRLRRSYGEDEVRYFFEKLDTNMDGLIDLAEFRTAMLALI
jgi:Ca2+-binding EF-hand superfamily protein